MTFSLRTFGGLKLLDSDGHDVAFPEKGLLILGYLLAGSMERELRSTIAQFLWGHDDNGSAQVNLRKLVSRIKSRQAELGVQFLRFTETVIELEPSSLASDMSFIDGTDEPLSKLAQLVETMESSSWREPIAKARFSPLAAGPERRACRPSGDLRPLPRQGRSRRKRSRL